MMRCLLSEGSKSWGRTAYLQGWRPARWHDTRSSFAGWTVNNHGQYNNVKPLVMVFFSHLQPIRTSWLLRWLFDHERAKTRGIRSEMRCGCCKLTTRRLIITNNLDFFLYLSWKKLLFLAILVLFPTFFLTFSTSSWHLQFTQLSFCIIFATAHL